MDVRKTSIRAAMLGTGLLVCSISHAGQGGLLITLNPSQLFITVVPSPLSAKEKCGFLTRKVSYKGTTIQEMLSMIPGTKKLPAEKRLGIIKKRISAVALSYQKQNRLLNRTDISYHDNPTLPTIHIGAVKEHIITVDPFFAHVRNMTQQELGNQLKGDLFDIMTKQGQPSKTTLIRLRNKENGQMTFVDHYDQALKNYIAATEKPTANDKESTKTLLLQAEAEADKATSDPGGYPVAAITLARIRIELGKHSEAAEALIQLDDFLNKVDPALAKQALDNLDAISMDKLSGDTKAELKDLKKKLEARK